VLRLPIELIPRTPLPVRIVLRNAVWAYGAATSFARPLPDFLIIGAQKAGTTSLYTCLRWHPAITGPIWKEVSYFDLHYARRVAWYRGNFPTNLPAPLSRRHSRVQRNVGEASPSYLFHPLAPERVAALIPNVRLIALLRNPIDRALSHYHHEVALRRERLPFEEALEQEEARTHREFERIRSDPRYFSHAWWNFTYLARGRYAEQLERWLTIFPPEQMLILPSEQFFETPGKVYARVLEFLGAHPHQLASYPHIFRRDYPAMNPATRRKLTDYYREPNERLYRLLNCDLPWT
jgi:Sulfotransferase domain